MLFNKTYFLDTPLYINTELGDDTYINSITIQLYKVDKYLHFEASFTDASVASTATGELNVSFFSGGCIFKKDRYFTRISKRKTNLFLYSCIDLLIFVIDKNTKKVGLSNYASLFEKLEKLLLQIEGGDQY